MARKTKFTADDVIETAFNLVRKNGWPGLSVTAVANALDCSTMPIYSHFQNLDKLADAVVRKAWQLFFEYDSKSYTGDAWIDQALGSIHFAREEKRLFMCLYDGRNLKLQRELIKEHWAHLSEFIETYEPFSNLDTKQRDAIRHARAMFCHGVGTSIAMDWYAFSEEDINLEKYLSMTSQALLEGYKEIYARDGVKNPFIGE